MEMLKRMTRLDIIAVVCVFNAIYFMIGSTFLIYTDDIEVTFNLVVNLLVLLIPQLILGISKLLYLFERKEDG